MICSTCFRHLYAHHQELETILVLLPHIVCNALVAGSRLLGVEQQAMHPGWGKLCPKHVEQIKIAIKHSVASSWFSPLRLYYDARTNIYQIESNCLSLLRNITKNLLFKAHPSGIIQPDWCTDELYTTFSFTRTWHKLWHFCPQKYSVWIYVSLPNMSETIMK